MAELEELSQYVFVHPDDYERRWTLAKKLYMAWEYNDALKHLLILKKNWARKLNVLRYLAATYYRLGRYDEAITELREIVKLWPHEIAVHEQLARVYEIAGRTRDAAEAWEHIVKINPGHPIAARTVQRLRSTSSDTRREDLRLRDSDSGIDLSPYRICPNCGAQNSDEFDRCWQCHSTLRSGNEPLVDGVSPRVRGSRAWLRTLVLGLLTVAALTTGVYLTFVQLQQSLNASNIEASASVYDVLAEKLLVTRLICAGVLLLAWPAGLWLGFRVVSGKSLRWQSAFGAGLLLTSLTYLAMWMPVTALPYAPPVAIVGSLLLIIALNRDSKWRSLGIWIVHGFIPLLAGLGAFVASEGIRPLSEFPAILRFQRTLGALSKPGVYPLFSEAIPARCLVQWATTDSTWLDEKSSRVVLEFVPEVLGHELRVEVKLGGEVIGETSGTRCILSLNVQTGSDYEIWVYGPEGAYFTSQCRGILIPFVTN